MSQQSSSVANQKIERMVTGKVVSVDMDKTIVVLVERQIKHPKYKKYLIKNTKLYAHDAENTCKQGDVVVITQCRPISKSKSWKLVKILEGKS